MNKNDILERMTKEHDFPSRAAAQRALDAVIESLKYGIKKDKAVQIVGFGTFTVKSRKARKGRNPHTGEEIKIKASKSVGFKPGKALKETVNPAGRK